MPPLHRNIIAGKYKGKRLLLPSKETTRSSKAIVLESFFNTLQFEIVDTFFVELFAGSGSIGLEALSRGAAHAYLMERDKAVLSVLRRNVAAVAPGTCSVIAGDTFETFPALCRSLPGPAYFFIDPPFSIRQGHEAIYDRMLALIETIPQEKVRLITIEHMTALELPEQIGPFTVQKRKKFGKTSLSYYA